VRALKGTAPSRWTYFPAESPSGAWIREALDGANRSQASRDDAMEEWKDQIASRLGIRKTVQGVLRVGLATTPSRPVSPRRSLESFVERP
jgi:hypothetical protein